MKKLIGILVMLLITITSFGQGYYDKKEINEDINLKRGILREIDLEEYYYGFKFDNVKYVLAYREGQKKFDSENLTKENDYRLTKDLLLYKWNGDNWVVASTNVVQTDYWFISSYVNEGNIKCQSSDNYSYIIYKGLGNGHVDVQKDGSVSMLVTNRYVTNDIGVRKRNNYNVVITFEPNGDGTYTATRFK